MTDRRSSRTAGSKVKYNIDEAFGLSDEEGGGDEEGTASFQPESAFVEDDIKVVEKILGRRTGKRFVEQRTETEIEISEEQAKAEREASLRPGEDEIEVPATPSEVKNESEVAADQNKTPVKDEGTTVGSRIKKVVDIQETEEEVEEFFIKYKGLSYLHCEWRTAEEILDAKFPAKMKRYMAKHFYEDMEDVDDSDLFNPDYVEVERVLDVRIYKNGEIYNEGGGSCITGGLVASNGSASKRKQKVKEKPTKTIKPKGSKKRLRQEVDSQSTSRQTSIADEDEEPASSLADSTLEESNSMMDDSMATEQESEAPISPSAAIDEDLLVTYYLVKWKCLPYEDSTWELAQDVDPNKVKLFYKWRSPTAEQIPTPRNKDGSIVRPEQTSWKPLKVDEQDYKNGNKLRDYQIEGVSWLSFCWYNRQNCILADEMGLGKTVQSIAFMLDIYRARVQGPFLVIVPLSTVGNWSREFENWSDMNAVVYHGSGVSRNMIREYEIFYRKKKSAGPSALRTDLYKFHALITTFETLMSDIEFFASIKWVASIIDEAHRLKNKKCKLIEGLRYLTLDHRVLLTGTPLQNNVEELFALLNFLDPIKFNSEAEFLQTYGQLKTEDQVNNLKSILRPMMLRRLKDDVEKNLAPKEETIIEVELTNIQKKYYRAIMERNFDFLAKGCTSSNLPSLLNIMMELRKCCNHPYLIKGAEDNIIKDLRDQDEKMAKLDSEEARQIHALIYASGKLVLIHKLLPKLKANGHKVLIFSQMVRVLDILEDYISHQAYSYERIDGRIHGLARQEAIDRFSTTQARCHRIGQVKAVKVYRLITRNTYEREMFDRASLKLGLNKAVLESMGMPHEASSSSSNKGQLSKQEVEALLKKGAYGALMDDDKAGEEFCEADIDKILQSRSQVVTIDQTEQNSSFSKASFSIAGQRDDISIDDPEFWQKWAKIAGVQEKIPGHENIIEEPRMRRQVTRYQGNPSDGSAANGLNGFGRKLPGTPDDDSSGDSEASSDTASNSTKGGKTNAKNRMKRNRKLYQSLGLSAPLDRSELAKIERGLHTYGWGRWQAILESANFRRHIEEFALIRIAKAIIAFTLSCVPPLSDCRARLILEEVSKIGPRERSLAEIAAAAKKEAVRSQTTPFAAESEDLEPDDYVLMTVEEAEATIGCMNFCIHLQKSGLRFLQRVYQSFYVACDIVGEEQGEKLLRGECDHSAFRELENSIPSLQALDFELPVPWWDLCADKCLLLGLYKHGWDKYHLVQTDPALCFYCKLQLPPADQSCDMDTEEASEAPSPTPEEAAPKARKGGRRSKAPLATQSGELFPSPTDLNSRIRKLIGYFQRMKPQTEFELMRLKRKHRDDSLYQQLAMFPNAEIREIKWSRREEADFYRVVSSYGVEMLRPVRPALLADEVTINPADASQSPMAPEVGKAPNYNWDTFRQLANLGRKNDQALTDYFHAFYRMCQRICRRTPYDCQFSSMNATV
ncbi:choline dehydrogenase 6 [Cichlidogyrus casuarinus]|uniref:Choline dehydrogenase 6 n=1 Tax=Cichlidogyrus casuarinus TaxID=1844966 RepID=A0ABD2QN83_9PLAT